MSEPKTKFEPVDHIGNLMRERDRASDACASVQKERDELREEVKRLQIIKDREAALKAARAADPDYVHEGTIEDLAGVARMIEIWTPETFPVSEHGQIHFGRAMLECAAGEIRAFLARYEAMK